MRKFLWPLLLLVSALVVAAGILGVIGGGPAPRAVTSPSLVDGEDRPVFLDVPTGVLRVVGLVRSPCVNGCAEALDQLVRLGHDYTEEVEFLVLVGDVRLAPDARLARSRVRMLHGTDEALIQLFSKQLGFAPGDVSAFEEGDSPLLVAVVDRAEKVRGRYAVGRETDEATWARVREEIDFRLSLAWRPLLHAWINAISALLLTVGFVFIRKKMVAAHLTCMLLTTFASLVFLASYLHYHHHVGSMPFRGEGWVRTLYFTILLSHTVLAAVVPPLAATLLVLAARGRTGRHKRIARWTLPMWLYVSMTGVVIYLMLYVWFGPG